MHGGSLSRSKRSSVKRMAYVNIDLDAEEIFGPKEEKEKEAEEETV